MARPSVLLVENDERFRKTVCDVLEPAGYEVKQARTPMEAESEAKDSHFAAAVVDVRLLHEDDPFDWSGLTLARKLGEQMPVILLTAYDDATAIERAYMAAPGAPRIRAFISKNARDWDKQLLDALSENIKPSGGVREWLREHWQEVKTALKVVRHWLKL